MQARFGQSDKRQRPLQVFLPPESSDKDFYATFLC